MLAFSHLSHVSVTVSDLDRAKAFYGGLLGLREIPRPDFGSRASGTASAEISSSTSS